MPEEYSALYRPRRAQTSPLYRLVDTFYDEVKGRWEEAFERRYGFWRGSIEDAAYAFLDCGVFDRGFARLRCPECRAELLVAFSCQRRGFCPSCAAKRGALFGALLAEEVVEDVGHCLWTFTIPKMLRVFFLHHRELLGGLCRAGWEVVRELMATAVGDPTFRPGMVAVVQTHGDRLGWHPHVHAIATRGGWDSRGSFVPIPFVSTTAAEHLLRHKVITLLRDEDLLTEERIELLMSWRHSGSMDLGADVVGGIPWIEYTEADEQRHIDEMFDIARAYDADVSMLVDDAGDPGLRTLEKMAVKALEVGWIGRCLAHHARAMSLYPEPYFKKVAALLKKARLGVVSDPHTGPLHARVKELLAEGALVALGQDDIADAYYPFGRNNMLEVGFLGAHLLWMTTFPELDKIYDMITLDAARAMNVDRFGIKTGQPAHLVVLNAQSTYEALWHHEEPLHVISHGRLVDLTALPS